MKNIKNLSIILFLCSFLQACLSDKDLFGFEYEFDNGIERIILDDVALSVRRGSFVVDVGSKENPVSLVKTCIDDDCTQTLFEYNGDYFDFSFITDGNWTGDLSQLPKEEIEQLLWTQAREINAVVRFYEVYEKINPLLFTINPSWLYFSAGHVIGAGEATVGENKIVKIDVYADVDEAFDPDGNILSADLRGSIDLFITL